MLIAGTRDEIVRGMTLHVWTSGTGDLYVFTPFTGDALVHVASTYVKTTGTTAQAANL